MDGGAEGDRTPDLCNAIAALSQLSYGPNPVAPFRARFPFCKREIRPPGYPLILFVFVACGNVASGDVKVTMSGGSSCSTFCGYHGHFNYGGVDIRYAVFPFLDCNACRLSNLSVADMLTIVASHEIREAVTDPQLNAWYDSSGYEADDKCAWHNLYRMAEGGFWVQPEYSNGGAYPGPGCVVPPQPVP